MGAEEPSQSAGPSGLADSAERVWRERVLLPVEGASGAVTGALDAGLGAASGAVAAATAAAQRQAGAAKAAACSWWRAGAERYTAAEGAALATAKEAIAYGVEHKEAAAAAGLAAAAVLLPGPRRLLLRSTLGRLRSADAALRSAGQRGGALAERLEAQVQEAGKLQERLAAAEAEYARGAAKLSATKNELESLASRVASSEKAAKALLDELRELPQHEALALRSSAAQAATRAASAQAGLEKAYLRLAKQGL